MTGGWAGMSFKREYEGSGFCFLEIVLGLGEKMQERRDGS